MTSTNAAIYVDLDPALVDHVSVIRIGNTTYTPQKLVDGGTTHLVIPNAYNIVS